MEKIVWNNSYSVGNEWIDNQHKQIIKMINALLDNHISLDAASDQLHDLLDSMTSYFRAHFVDEEKFLEEIAFPELEMHKKLHLDYIDKTVDLTFDAILRKDNVSNAMMQFLVYWWENHILIEDMKYKEFFSKAKNELTNS
jgi:hemerythrin-like metal-binding protein